MDTSLFGSDGMGERGGLRDDSHQQSSSFSGAPQGSLEGNSPKERIAQACCSALDALREPRSEGI